MKTANEYLNRVVKSIKSVGLALLACVILILLTPQMSSAYDNDTHFWLTYYLSVKAGYTNIEATQIASANVGVDFDKDTEPLIPRFDSWKDWLHALSHWQRIRIQLHALPLTAEFFNSEWWNPTKREINDDKLKKLIDARKSELWKETLSERKNPGVFLHYLQDTYAHRGFTSYIGHAGYYYVDFLDSDRDNAKLMALKTFKYLIVFRKALSTGKESQNLPNPETIEIEDLLSTEAAVQIKNEINNAVDEFCKVNPSAGVRPNILVEDWENLDEETKLNFKKPPAIYACSLLHIKNNGPAPDSSKARAKVKELLNLEEHALPHIWLYNFNSAGKSTKRYAEKALVYVPYKSPKKIFTANDETKNTEKRTIKVNSKKQCLSFSLEAMNTDPFNCK
ncbi:MAG: hypothetical protein ICV60_00775 [Pyrinomonadaceae bacterium]|nr:hypothetical protein [Pyrinomonadaceae bacterium]